jgi:hypothetical protein
MEQLCFERQSHMNFGNELLLFECLNPPKGKIKEEIGD